MELLLVIDHDLDTVESSRSSFGISDLHLAKRQTDVKYQ
jgi:hypothetical protein